MSQASASSTVCPPESDVDGTSELQILLKRAERAAADLDFDALPGDFLLAISPSASRSPKAADD
jgi:hypothetical protein